MSANQIISCWDHFELWPIRSSAAGTIITAWRQTSNHAIFFSWHFCPIHLSTSRTLSDIHTMELMCLELGCWAIITIIQYGMHCKWDFQGQQVYEHTLWQRWLPLLRRFCSCCWPRCSSWQQMHRHICPELQSCNCSGLAPCLRET